MSPAFAMIMAGADNADLSVLTEIRSEPAVPFAGKFRLIDFSLSNCVNSGIHNVAVLTQYRPRSLNDHIGIGKPWDLDRSSGGVRLLQPYRGGPYGDWQRGSADAIRRNLDYVIQQKEECVLILSGKHIYLMDYRPFLEHHQRTGAPVTIAVRRVSRHETHRFGIVSQDADDRVVEFQEKPRRTQQNLASMGVYIFNRDYLVEVLSNGGGDDIGRDILPGLVAKRHVNSYTYPGYWADASTVQAYWDANMSLLAEEPALNLYAPEWVVHTRSQERAPVKLGPAADVDGALLSNGCQIEGAVERSVFPLVYRWARAPSSAIASYSTTPSSNRAQSSNAVSSTKKCASARTRTSAIPTTTIPIRSCRPDSTPASPSSAKAASYPPPRGWAATS